MFAATLSAGARPPEGQRFAPASQAAGKTLFTPLAPATTGLVVDNRYDDPEMWGRRYRPFMGGAMGSGVAVGDYDGDGRPDLFVSTKTKLGRLFRNLGGWKFADVTESAGLAGSGSMFDWVKGVVGSDREVVWHQGAVFADVNNDGRPDLLVCRSQATNLLFINQGNGRFTEEAGPRGLAIVDGSAVGAFADYDRDGWLDVLILTNQMDGTEPLGRPDRLFRNRGDGRFEEVTATAGLGAKTFGHAATWFDYNGDRWPDLYVCNDFSGPDALYRNNGNGTFTNVIDEVIPHTPFSSMGADVGDIDNDGHFDLLAADMATTTREKDRRGLAASRNDMIATAATERTAPQYMRSALYLNTGLGTFGEVACWAGVEATDWTWSPRFEDFDNDGWTDLHVTNGMVREANNTDLLADMMRALSDQQRIARIKQAPPLNEANLAYRNRGGEGFEPATAAWGLGEVGVSFGSATADFDQDGDLDLVYLNYDGGLSVLRNDVAGAKALQVRLRGTRSNRQAAGAVVRIATASGGQQARVVTITRGYASGSELVAHFGLGSDAQVARLTIEWPSGATEEFTDLEAGQAYVVVEDATTSASPGPSTAAGARAVGGPTGASPLFKAAGEAMGLRISDTSGLAVPDKEQAFIPFRTDRRGPAVAVADIDGDGQDELFLGSTTGEPARLVRRVGDRYVAQAWEAARRAGAEDGPALFLDYDGDGRRDLLVTRASANATAWPDAFQPTLYRNDGHGSFTATAALPPLPLNVGAACAADVDGDGDLDLFLGGRSIPGRYPEAPPSVLLRNDRGSFVPMTSASPALERVGLVTSALFRDLDLDGAPDLLVALEWDHVRFFRNDGRGGFADHTGRAGFASGGRGWWTSLASADLNGDGRPDIVAGNLGLNTTYRATAERPAKLLYGDFARNGTRLIVEAVHDEGTLYPLRSRSDLATRLPFVLRRFPRNDDFARAPLERIFGEAVGTAEVHAADNFAAGVFLSQPDGRYHFSALPRRAQLGPIHGLVATDFDGDGDADVCALQNTDAAAPRFHGGFGIFLQGDGTGALTAVHPTQSGVVVSGNGRALALLPIDEANRPDFFLTRHGGATELLQQASHARWIRLQLVGSTHNPDAVGARVEFTPAGGKPSHHEIGLGGGVWSQSSPHLLLAVPEGSGQVEAVVTWPDGRRSRHRAPSTVGRWIVERPAAP